MVAYGALLPPAALDVPPHGWVNLHFSLLPAWRGAAPVQHAILHGDEITGAATFRIEAGLDTGPVYGVVTEPIRPDDTAGELLDRLAVSGATLLVATMDGIADGSLVPRPQPADGRVGRRQDHRGRCRAALGRAGPARGAAGPGVHPRPRRLDHLPRRAAQARPGAAARRHRAGAGTGCGWTRSGVAVGTAGAEVGLGLVQPPGKRPMPAADWARGARIGPGERLGRVDPARLTAYRLLRAVAAEDAYANLALPRLLADARLPRRDAALATELGYGTLRAPGPWTRSSPTASTARWPTSSPRCSTCCGSAPTSCCAPASRRTPPSAPPWTWPGPPAAAAPPGSSTPCCAG